MESLFDGTLDLYAVSLMQDKITVDEENKSRVIEALKRER